MEIWLDTVDLDVILQAKEMGILHGVTTNPKLICSKGGCVEDILDKVLQSQSGPVAVQVTNDSASDMILQGEALNKYSFRIIVKIPATQEGFKAIHFLSSKKIPTMATAVFTPGQVLLAARAGASYIAPYFSSILEVDGFGRKNCKTMYDLLERYKFPTKLIAASLKSLEQINSCIEIGVHALTLRKEVFLSLMEAHVETDRKVRLLLEGWENIEKRVLPL